MLNQKGHIHLFAVAGIILAVMIGYAVFTKYYEQRQAGQTVLYDQPADAGKSAISDEQ